MKAHEKISVEKAMTTRNEALERENKHGMNRRCMLCGELVADSFYTHMPYTHARNCPIFPNRLDAEKIRLAVTFGEVHPNYLAALSHPPVDTEGWNDDFSKAPKDGIHKADIYVPGRGRMPNCFWVSMPNLDCKGWWRTEGPDGIAFMPREVSHWRLEPTPPQANPEVGG